MEKVYIKFHKVHFTANGALLITKSALLQRKECFIHTTKHSLWAIQHNFPRALSAG